MKVKVNSLSTATAETYFQRKFSLVKRSLISGPCLPFYVNFCLNDSRTLCIRSANVIFAFIFLLPFFRLWLKIRLCYYAVFQATQNLKHFKLQIEIVQGVPLKAIVPIVNVANPSDFVRKQLLTSQQWQQPCRGG